jgi:hypothetical protein
VATWRLVALSTGEFTLETAAAAAGLQTTAGQEVRLLNICVDRRGRDDLRGLPWCGIHRCLKGRRRPCWPCGTAVLGG